jgi:hypothetical protein
MVEVGADAAGQQRAGEGDRVDRSSSITTGITGERIIGSIVVLGLRSGLYLGVQRDGPVPVQGFGEFDDAAGEVGVV